MHKDSHHKKHTSHKKTKRQKRLHLIKNIAIACVALGLLGISGLLIWFSTLSLPTLDAFDQRKVVTSSKIYDRTGEILLFDFHKDISRTIIPADEIAPVAKQATIAIEDDQFYEHNGIQVKAIIRAILTNLKNGDLLGGQGGSTITQQVIKNALLTTDKKVSRKFKEWVLALRLEQEYSKDEILGIYLNEIPYGGTLYGIEEASQSFFGKSARDLTLPEAAYLAALPQAPTFYSPFGNNVDKLEARKNTVLRRMKNLDFITEEEYEEARQAEITFLQPRHSQNSALHFIQYVREYLEAKYGSDALINDGLRVVTTLDYELQQKAEEIVLESALKNEEQYNASNQALVALENNTGQIITMVGSRDYLDTEIDGNFNVALARRQPGSSFKPFVYATAFSQGYTDSTILFDTRTQFSTAAGCTPDNLTSAGDCYSPQNYDNEEKGPLTLRNALAQSRNIPAVKLLYLVGIQNSISTARGLGITTLSNNPNQYGLTLVLGGGEVRLLDMASAYSTFANDGLRVEPTAILRVEDHDGNVLEEFSAEPRRVLDAEAARTISSILSDNTARTPLFGSNSFMYFGANTDVAGKTGTTNDNKDAWLVGYTSEVSVGVWSGNNDNQPMTKGSSISGSSWRAYLVEANKKYPPQRFRDPAPVQVSKPILNGQWRGGETFTIDIISQKLATEYTPEAAKAEIVIADPHSILHWVKPSDPRGPIPENPQSNSQYERWEYGVMNWLLENNPEIFTTETEIPTEYDDVHSPDKAPHVNISNMNVSLAANQSVTLSPIVTSHYPIIRVEYFLNGKFIGESKQNPFSFTYLPSESELQSANELTIVATDNTLQEAEATLSL